MFQKTRILFYSSKRLLGVSAGGLMNGWTKVGGVILLYLQCLA